VLIFIGRFKVEEIGIVTALVPQLNVIIPPVVTAAFNAANVQLAAVPLPTTLVGLETLTAWAPEGSALLQEVGIVIPPGGVGVEFDPFEELEFSFSAEFDDEPQFCNTNMSASNPMILKNEDPIFIWL
jgi:hypothetical protein